MSSVPTKPDPGLPKAEPGLETDELFDFQGNEDDASWEEETLASTSSAARAAKEPRKTGTSRVLDLGHILKAPRASQYSTQTFYDMIKDNLVDLEPEYQRGVVWPDTKQSAIIESIMRHYYVPPILLSVYDNKETGETTYICIDGKQRLSSVVRFLNNGIPVREPATGRKFFFKPNPLEPRAACLSPAQRRKFQNEQLTCVEFEGLTDEIERDMFARVQMGVTLSSAEKLAAHLGPWPDYIRQLVKKYLDAQPGLSTDEYNDQIIAVNRGKDYLFMAQIALLIVHAKVPRYIPTASQIDNFLKNHTSTPPSEDIKREIAETLVRYVALANHSKYGECIKSETRLLASGRKMPKPLSPVEFVYIGFLIHQHSYLKLSQLYQLIQQMKKEVRPQFKDIMFNTTVASVLRNFIETAKVPAPYESDDDSVTLARSRKHPRAPTEDGEYQPSGSSRSRIANGVPRQPSPPLLFRDHPEDPLSNRIPAISVNRGDNFYGASSNADLANR